MNNAMASSVNDGAIDRDALLALQAFAPAVALIDVMHRIVRWCSSPFSSRYAIGVGDSLTDLYQRLPSARQTLEAMLEASHRAQPSARAGMVRAQWVQAGLIVLITDLDPASAAAGQDTQATRRHLEDCERLLFTSRNLSVSEMASTLAHELNQPIGAVANLLAGIQSRLQSPHSASAAPQDLLDGVRLALNQTLFAAGVIARIRDHTRARRPQQDRLDINDVLRSALTLLDWEIQRDAVHIQFDASTAPCEVIGDAVMLQQVLVNLLRNAIEAMRSNGTGARELTIIVSTQRDGRDVEIAIRDNGCGLPIDAEQILFAPLQSSKPNGMGIGLNICRSLIEMHQGRLWFTRHAATANGAAGSTFHLSLPRCLDHFQSSNRCEVQ